MDDGDLVLDAIEKRYGRHRALAGVSTRFAPGRVSAILGPNGAGKSTLLAILATLVPASAGSLTWRGRRLLPGGSERAAVGYVGHEPGLYPDLSARENLRLFAALYGVGGGDALVGNLLDRVGLAAELASRPDTPVRTFSRGMQQRLALARALLHDPAIVLFDEPSSALDPTGVTWLAAQLTEQRRAGRIVVIVTHDLDAAAAVADHVLILRRGRVMHDEAFSGTVGVDRLRALYQEKTGGAS